MQFDTMIIGAGPGGIFTAYELLQKCPERKIAVLEMGHALSGRKCPIDGEKIKSCIHCKTCSIMSGFGGAGAFSDGKYNITNDFGGTLYEYIGKKQALELMHYVDDINMRYGGAGTKLYSTAGSAFKRICIQHKLNLLDASVRHLGTDINYVVLENLYAYLSEKVSFFFNTQVTELSVMEDGSYCATTAKGETFEAKTCVVSVGRSGSKWMESVCKNLGIATKSNRVDLGVRVELPAVVFSELTDELYESKIVYRTEKFEDNVRTFCMNPHGIVVNENTNGIVTVNGHSYEDPKKQTENTNFALLVSKHFSEPFEDSNGYGESIARLSNMLGGGVMVQRFGDLIRGRRSNARRIERSTTIPTLNATPGDLSLVLPKRILDGIIEMIYALDKIAPGTANDDTLLYGVEVKFYNMEVALNEHLETVHKGLYIIGDGSGITHSLSHASASGVYVARNIAGRTDL
ncbi:MAG: NAD(P)/FAD-dependent oxidoreductase [Clostridia bacterium]|nr:NAD(P)/FAD-dependent oxidoreductase [Clostridia bacterium]